MISKALIDSNITHELFIPVTNEEQKLFILKESIRTREDQLSNIEQNRLIV